jgi:hypothetical protein
VNPIKTARTNALFQADGKLPTPAQRCHAVVDAGEGNEPSIVPAIRIFVKPTEEERFRICCGAEIELIILGDTLPAMLMKTSHDPVSAIWEDRPER